MLLQHVIHASATIATTPISGCTGTLIECLSWLPESISNGRLIAIFVWKGSLRKCVAVLDARDDVVLAYLRTLLLLWGPDGEEVVSEYINNLNIEDDRPSDRFRKYLDRERINNVMHGVIRASALRKTSLIRPLPGSDISMIAELSLLSKFIEIPEPLFARRF